MNLDQRIQRDRDRERQPLLCRGCPFGTWTGTKQTCIRLECVKEQPRNFLQWVRLMKGRDQGFSDMDIHQQWEMYQRWKKNRG
ncbi:hypothetical protein [Gorillibacterium sp. sgz5001074]|uniref:hypothetical protein n=1 Tax=Gorillibacterium sp. sgz5001074 TaxID=3446695 RepID=UPI003F67777D